MPPTAVDQRHARVTKKSKKQREEDDFEKLLSALNKATQSATPREPTKKAAPRGRDPRNLWSNNEPPMANKGDGLSSMQARMTQSEREFNAGMEMIQRLLRERAMIPRSFLDAPNTEFRGSTTKRNKHFNVGVGEMQGWRAHMEDVHLIDVQFPFDGQVESKEGLFCVFDGHAGKDCAMKCGELFPKVLRKHTKMQPDGFHSVDFDTAFLEVDEQLRRASIKGGCTAVAVHVTPIGVHCSSVGDSRAVLCRDGAAFDLSNDHKPELEEETDRILAAGGTVSDNRVNGSLAMSRAMGDFTFKEVKGKGIREQLVIAVPDVISATREPTDTFVVLACDGIFDVLSNEELIAFVVEKKGLGLDNKEICQLVCDHCISPVSSETGQPVRVKGTDNMTIMIVDLLM